MVFKYAYIIPILIGVWFPVTFIVTYLMAVSRGDVNPVFPYISDTGNWTPESCFFGFMLNTGAILQGLGAYIRYRQVRDLSEKKVFKSRTQSLNKISMILATLACLGVVLVGNFQETRALAIHIFGAGLGFGLGSIFLCLQTKISFDIYPILGNKAINITRLICSVVVCISALGCAITGGLAFLQYDGDDITKWDDRNKGYRLHFISAILEWIVALGTILFLALFTSEFRVLSISEPLVTQDLA